jgi:hypothetical protein
VTARKSRAESAVGAHGDDEQIWAFYRAFKMSVGLPCDGFVIGEPMFLAVSGGT